MRGLALLQNGKRCIIAVTYKMILMNFQDEFDVCLMEESPWPIRL